MFGSRRLFNYSQASLPLKISLPFILMFIGLWAASSAVLGQYVSKQLDEEQQERAAELASLVEREINRELEGLRRNARLLSTKGLIYQHVFERDRIGIQQEILPIKSILKTDVITVIDRRKNVLMDARQFVLKDVRLRDQSVIDLLLTGSDVSAVVAAEDGGPPVLVGTSTIKDQQGISGGIILGVALSSELLAQINDSIQEQMVVFFEDQIVASTFQIDHSKIPSLEHINGEGSVRLKRQSFLTETIHLHGLNDEKIDLVLLVSNQSITQAKVTLWLVIVVVALLGTLLTVAGSYWMARKIADPIQAITAVAYKVVKEEDFNLRAVAETPDEIGMLANALNQLIQWVEQYTYELEVAGQTLEYRVEARTKELADTLEKLQETQAQLIQTEKMSSLGQMVAGIAHEINNPLSFIQGNLPPLNEYFEDLLDLIGTYQTQYPQPNEVVLKKQEQVDLEFMLEDLSKLLDSMKLGAQRVQDIVVSLRNYSRLDEASIKDVDIHEGLDNTLLLLNHRIKHEVEVIKDYGSLLPVRCSPAQLNQVFTNIIANALDAMFEAASEPKQLIITTRSPNAEQVQISIRDSGPGISPAVKAKMFDPFFTTKGIGKGTGLGLSICFKIIEQHHGSIKVDSEAGKGTEFVITLLRDVLPLEPKADADATLVAAS